MRPASAPRPSLGQRSPLGSKSVVALCSRASTSLKKQRNCSCLTMPRERLIQTAPGLGVDSSVFLRKSMDWHGVGASSWSGTGTSNPSLVLSREVRNPVSLTPVPAPEHPLIPIPTIDTGIDCFHVSSIPGTSSVFQSRPLLGSRNVSSSSVAQNDLPSCSSPSKQTDASFSTCPGFLAVVDMSR